jgi:tRNA-dihydrouridine synthase
MTIQMNESYYTYNRVEEVISTLKSLTHNGDCVDGETMQYILEKVGMDWQMLRQLMLTMPLEQVEYLIEERKDINGK